MGAWDVRGTILLVAHIGAWLLAWRLGRDAAVFEDQPGRRVRGVIWLVECLPLTLLPPVLNVLLRAWLEVPGAVLWDRVLVDVWKVIYSRLPYNLLGLAVLGLWLGLWTKERIEP